MKVRVFKITKNALLNYCVVSTNADQKAFCKMLKSADFVEAQRTINNVPFTFIHAKDNPCSVVSVKSKTNSTLDLCDSVIITKKENNRFVSLSKEELTLIKQRLDLWGTNCLTID